MVHLQRLLCLLIACLGAPSATHAQGVMPPSYIAEAVASPFRAPKDVARDSTQRPAERLV